MKHTMPASRRNRPLKTMKPTLTQGLDLTAAHPHRCRMAPVPSRFEPENSFDSWRSYGMGDQVEPLQVELWRHRDRPPSVSLTRSLSLVSIAWTTEARSRALSAAETSNLMRWPVQRRNRNATTPKEHTYVIEPRHSLSNPRSLFAPHALPDYHDFVVNIQRRNKLKDRPN
jgi:hypothetical protein